MNLKPIIILKILKKAMCIFEKNLKVIIIVY